MPVYSGFVDPELEEDFKHRVTWKAKPVEEEEQYDKWGKPVKLEGVTEIPAFWIAQSKVVLNADNQQAILKYVKVLLPHDVVPSIGDTLLNEVDNTELIVNSVNPPIYADDTSIPCMVILQ